jgi:MoaA/NifB/PqqE/SkfB family radical SAM enzyme
MQALRTCTLKLTYLYVPPGFAQANLNNMGTVNDCGILLLTRIESEILRCLKFSFGQWRPSLLYDLHRQRLVYIHKFRNVRCSYLLPVYGHHLNSGLISIVHRSLEPRGLVNSAATNSCSFDVYERGSIWAQTLQKTLGPTDG